MAINLVLGGGGARGFFHFGVLKALQELGVEVKEISGNSIGAIVGTIYAHNPSTDFDALVKNLNFMKLAKLSHVRTGFISSSKIEKLLRELIDADDFNDLKIPLSFNAVDINTGKEIVFRRGKIFPALMASFAIPGLFPLVKHNNRLLCDGGLLNNLPIDHIKSKGKVLVSDIRIPMNKITEKSRKMDVMKNVYLIPRYKYMDFQYMRTKRELVYMGFHEHYHIFDFRKSKLRHMIELGYNEVMKNKHRL